MYMTINDRQWTPANEEQAESRFNRIVNGTLTILTINNQTIHFTTTEDQLEQIRQQCANFAIEEIKLQIERNKKLKVEN